MTDQPSPPKRRRGAQPGNTNALKHGLNSRRINLSDLYKLGANPDYENDQHIAQLRLYIKDLFDERLRIENFSDSLILLKKIGIASGILTRFLIERHDLKIRKSKLQSAFRYTIAQTLIQEYKLRQGSAPLPPPPIDDPHLN